MNSMFAVTFWCLRRQSNCLDCGRTGPVHHVERISNNLIIPSCQRNATLHGISAAWHVYRPWSNEDPTCLAHHGLVPQMRPLCIVWLILAFPQRLDTNDCSMKRVQEFKRFQLPKQRISSEEWKKGFHCRTYSNYMSVLNDCFKCTSQC